MADTPAAKPKTGKHKLTVAPAPAESGETATAIPPELVELFKAALDTLPPNTLTQVLKKHWGWVLTLLFPLALTTYQSVSAIIQGPAQVAALTESTKQDHADVVQIKKDLAGLDTKLDRVLWIMQTQGGARPYPASQPDRY